MWVYSTKWLLVITKGKSDLYYPLMQTQGIISHCLELDFCQIISNITQKLSNSIYFIKPFSEILFSFF